MSAGHVIGAAVGATIYTLVAVATYDNLLTWNDCMPPEKRDGASVHALQAAIWPLQVLTIGVGLGVFGAYPVCHARLPDWTP